MSKLCLKKSIALKKLYPKINKPSQVTRILLASVAQSMVSYAAPVWHQISQNKKYSDLLNILATSNWNNSSVQNSCTKDKLSAS